MEARTPWGLRTAHRFHIIDSQMAYQLPSFMVPSTCFALASKVFDPSARIYDIEALKEKDRIRKKNDCSTRDRLVEPKTNG